MNKNNFFKILITIIVSLNLLNGAVFASGAMFKKMKAVINSDIQERNITIMRVSNSFLDDNVITEKVKSALKEDEDIDSGDISIKTHRGVVTLNGSVSSYEQGEKAVSIAKNLVGVKSVKDALHIKNCKDSKEYGEDIAATTEIQEKFLADELISKQSIKVNVVKGIAHLSGMVENKEQLDRAENIARSISGIKSVDNDLKVKP